MQDSENHNQFPISYLRNSNRRENVSNEVCMGRDLVNFYRCVRFHLDPLLTEIEFVLNSREEFLSFKDQPGLTDIQRAARWFHRNKTCFGGCLGSFGISPTSGMSSRAARMETVRALNARLDRTTIERTDWEKCLSLYDRPETFFFMDPPYTGCGDTAYAAWTTTDVQKFRERLSGLRGQWLVTFNDSASIRLIFEGCDIRAIERAKGINNRGSAKGKTYREVIISPRRDPAAGCSQPPAS